MGGPIVRSGPSPEYSKNWDDVFSSKKGTDQQAEESPDDAAKAKSADDDETTG